MTLTADPIEHPPVTQADVDALRDRSCTGKIAYSAGTARKVAREHGMEAYPCRWCVDPRGECWHVGHALTMARLEHWARVLRAVINGDVSL